MGEGNVYRHDRESGDIAGEFQRERQRELRSR
jgi:hypothetical protein